MIYQRDSLYCSHNPIERVVPYQLRTIMVFALALIFSFWLSRQGGCKILLIFVVIFLVMATYYYLVFPDTQRVIDVQLETLFFASL